MQSSVEAARNPAKRAPPPASISRKDPGPSREQRGRKRLTKENVDEAGKVAATNSVRSKSVDGGGHNDRNLADGPFASLSDQTGPRPDQTRRGIGSHRGLRLRALPPSPDLDGQRESE